MRRIIITFSLLIILLMTGCTSDTPTDALSDTNTIAAESSESQDNKYLNTLPASAASIKQIEEITINSGLLSDVIDLDKYHYIGFDGKDSFIIRQYDDFKLKKVNIGTGETTEIMDISTGKGHFIMAEIYTDDWVIWSESLDKDLHIGISTGDDWAVCAANIETMEIIEIDSEKESFPKDRDYNAQPLAMSAKGEILAYTCYDSDESGVYIAIKAYNFRTKELSVIAKQEDSSRGFSTPSVGDSFVVFSDSLLADNVRQDSIIYVYDIKNRTLSTIDNDRGASRPVTSGRYIAASVPEIEEQAGESIIIYDTQHGEWIQEIDGSAPIYKDYSYPLYVSSLQMIDHYLVWIGTLDQAFYVYDIESNTFYELFGKEDNRFLGYILYCNNDLLAWADDSANWDDGRFSYIILG